MTASSEASPRTTATSKKATKARAAAAAYKAKRQDLRARINILRDESKALAISAGELLARIRP